jgi:hypothetical protein
MTVSFVLRSCDSGPASKFVRRLEADTLLDWFRSAWDCGGLADDHQERYETALAWLYDELGTEVYGLGSFFASDPGEEPPIPETEKALIDQIDNRLYREGAVICRPHCIQVYTDDDDDDLAYYFFDDGYLREHGPMAAFLLHEDWRLSLRDARGRFTPAVPVIDLPGAAGGRGASYFVATALVGKCCLSELGPHRTVRISGVRLPQLADFLRAANPTPTWPRELTLLWSQLPEQGGPGAWSEAFRSLIRLPPFHLPGDLWQAAQQDRQGACRLLAIICPR